ncbi:hypothetical protein A3Q56_00517, partial [Intoshia linei]
MLSRTVDGTYGIVVVVASFIIYFIADGWSFSIPSLLVYFNQKYDIDQSTMSSFTLIAYAVPHLIGLLSSCMVNEIGYRIPIFIGSVIYVMSIILYDVYQNWTLCLLMVSVVASVGLGFLYHTSYLAVIAYYDKNLGKALGFLTLGSSVGGSIFPYFILAAVHFGLKAYMYILGGGIGIVLIPLCLIYIPPKTEQVEIEELVKKKKKTSEQFIKIFKKIQLEMFLNPNYTIFLVCGFMIGLNSSNPFVCIVYQLKKKFPTFNSTILVSCMSLSRGAGQLFIGSYCDYSNFSRLLIFSVSIFITGITFFLLEFFVNIYYVFICHIIYSFFYASILIMPPFCIKLLIKEKYFNNSYAYFSMTTGISMLAGSKLNDMDIKTAVNSINNNVKIPKGNPYGFYQARLEIVKGLLHYRNKTIVPIVSNSIKNDILCYFHKLKLYVHPGKTKRLQIIRSRYFWVGMHKDMETFVENCEKCNISKA